MIHHEPVIRDIDIIFTGNSKTELLSGEKVKLVYIKKGDQLELAVGPFSSNHKLIAREAFEYSKLDDFESYGGAVAIYSDGEIVIAGKSLELGKDIPVNLHKPIELKLIELINKSLS